MSGEAFVQIVSAVIALLGAVVTYLIVPYIKSKTTMEQQKTIEFWVYAAVKAAEQIFAGQGLGKEKKQYVVDFLNNLGIAITEAQLDILIESAVLELNRSEAA